MYALSALLLILLGGYFMYSSLDMSISNKATKIRMVGGLVLVISGFAFTFAPLLAIGS